MASIEEIKTALAAETAPIAATDLAKKMGLKGNQLSTQLARMLETKEVEKDQEGRVILSEAVRKAMQDVAARDAWGGAERTDAKPEDNKAEEKKAGVDTPPGPTFEQAQTTEYQQFLNYGLRIGVTPSIANLTAEHVFRGGDFHNLDWVWEGITQQGIRPDMAQRWFHSWRSFTHQAIPQSLASIVGTPLTATGAAVEGVKPAESGKGRREYMLGPKPTYEPVFVGEGNGIDYEDAISQARLLVLKDSRIVAADAGGGPMTLGSFGDELAKVIKAVQEIGGGQGAKSYIVTRDEKGGHKVQELDSSKPMVLDSPAPTTPTQVGKSYLVDAEGKVQEAEPGRPIVVIKQPSGDRPVKRYMIDSETGAARELGDEPIVIVKTLQPPPSTPLSTPITLTTPDGKPMVMDLNTYFAVEDHKAKVRREDDRHDMAMDIGKNFKELLKKAASAASHMVEKEEPEP